MRPTITLARIAGLGVLWLADPQTSSACSTTSRDIGLQIARRRPETMPQGGVLAITASAYGTTVEQAMLGLTEFRVTRDDVDVPGALEVVTVSSATSHDLLQYHDLILVWRPQQPLVVGDALLLHYTYTPGDFLDDEPIPFTVSDEPTTISLPPAEAFGRVVQTDESDRVCCEVGRDSCNKSSLCLPTRARLAASLYLTPARLAGDWPQGYLWVANVDANGDIGPRISRPGDPDRDIPIEDQHWGSWPYPIVFPADSLAPYCLVLGATSLVDGTSLVSDPLCVTADQLDEFDTLGPITLEPDLLTYALDNYRECLGAPVYEADGSPYPAVAEAKSGCTTTPGTNPPALLLLLALGLLHRRRTTGRARRPC